MPNWCSNSLIVSHKDAAMISRVKNSIDDGSLFNEFVPLPEEQKDNWYDWHVNNWGTKWDISNPFITCEEKNCIEVMFDTAWGPPIEFYRKIEELGFEVDATYCETGMGFLGEYADGNDECYEYDFSDENWRENLPEHIIERIEDDYECWKQSQEEEEQEEA